MFARATNDGVAIQAMNRIFKWLKLFFLIAVFLFAVFVLAIFFWPPLPPLPPLLQQISFRGGSIEDCPTDEDDSPLHFRFSLSISPELEQRLASQFPPGTGEDRLIAVLSEQGFKISTPCGPNNAVRYGEFEQKGGGELNPAIVARVYWKIDDQHRIVWTKGLAF